jgi:hypothetical protein
VQQLLTHPGVQGGLAPFLAAIAAALVLYPVRLSGVAAACGFFAAVYLTGHLGFEPTSATRKLLLVALAAPVLGAVADLAFRPTRAAGVVLGVAFGIAAFWVYLSVLAQMPPQRLVLYAVGVMLFVGMTVAFCLLSYAEPVRAGAGGVGLGLGAGISALFSGSQLFGLWGIALGVAAGAFLLLAMILGKRLYAGASLTLSMGVIGALVAAGAVLLGRLPWYYAAALALVPLAVRLPLPERSHPAAQAFVALLYSLLAAASVCVLVWMASRGR